jgi:hypothetical protein
MTRDQFQIKLVQAKLTGSALAIGTLLSMYFSRELFAIEHCLIAWPGMETLAKQALMPARTVRRAIRELQKRGLVQIIEGGGKQRGNQGRSHRYVAILNDTKFAIPGQTRSSYPDVQVLRPLKGPLTLGKNHTRLGSKEDSEPRTHTQSRRLRPSARSVFENADLEGFDDFEACPGPETLQ